MTHRRGARVGTARTGGLTGPGRPVYLQDRSDGRRLVEGKINVERRTSAPIYSKQGEVVGQLDLTGARWQGGEDLEEGAEAIEVAFVQHSDGEPYVAVRRTPPMPPDDHVIVYSQLEWDLFSRRAAEGYFNPDQVAERRKNPPT